MAPVEGDVLSYGTSDPGHTSIVTNSSVDGNGNGTIGVIEQNVAESGTAMLTMTNWVIQHDAYHIGTVASWMTTRPVSSQPTVVPTTAPTPVTYPTLAVQYSGVIHNTTYNLTATLAFTSILQNQNNFNGNVIVGKGTGLGGDGPITGVVQSNGAISFTDTISDGCCQATILMFVGTLHSDGSMSGTYSTDLNEQGTWQVTPG